MWVLLLYNFLSATYNLISGTNPHEEDYRLTVDWHSCGFFYSKTKRRRNYVRETDNLIPRYGLYHSATLRSVMKKNQRPFSRQKIRRLYEKLRAISTAISGRNFESKREAKWKTVWAKCSPLYFDSEVVGSARLCVHWKTVGRQGTTHFAQHH